MPQTPFVGVYDDGELADEENADTNSQLTLHDATKYHVDVDSDNFEDQEYEDSSPEALEAARLLSLVRGTTIEIGDTSSKLATSKNPRKRTRK